jgi:uncharacterized protein (DUF2249 family)
MKLFSIRKAGPDEGPGPEASPGGLPGESPEALPEERVHDLDVRPLLARGEEPLATILEHAGRVPAGHVLCLRAPFEPVPLYAVLGERGFSARAERLAPDDWRVWFHRAAGEAGADGAPRAGDGRGEAAAGGAGAGTDERCGGAFRKPASARAERGESGRSERPHRPAQDDGAVQGPYLLDVRRLDGPAKHATIHERFDRLGPGQALTIVNDHDPKPLYYELCAERADRFDASAYRSYRADETVWVAVLPVLTG